MPAASSSPCRWRAPETGKMKLNLDASFISVSGGAFFGAVVRRHLGAVISSLNVLAVKKVAFVAFFFALIMA